MEATIRKEVNICVTEKVTYKLEVVTKDKRKRQ